MAIERLIVGRRYHGDTYDIIVERVWHDEKPNFMKATIRKVDGEFAFTGPTTDMLVDTVRELFSEINLPIEGDDDDR